MNQSKIIIISGPTATGKTKLSIEVAKKYNAEIVNFDSLLFYKELNIGTAKPTQKEISQAKHHLVSTETIENPMDAKKFIGEAEFILKEIIDKNKNIVLVGGSGFYLRALMNGMYNSSRITEEIKVKVQSLYKNKNIDEIRNLLKEVDLNSYLNLHKNDHYRIIRAYEHYLATGSKISDEKKIQNTYLSNNIHFLKHIDCLHIYLDIPKNDHWKIIENRTIEMIQSGLVQEVKNLIQVFDKTLRPLKSVGYKECIDFLDKKIVSEEELIEKINISTRQLAKSQRTWFKKIHPKESYNLITDMDDIFKKIESFLVV